jgi:DNA-binding Lrp family transcriptional regulator
MKQDIRFNNSPANPASVSLDWGLLKALHDLEASPNVQVDPHPDVAALSAATGVTANTISKRLAVWRRSGFFPPCFYFPNPLLFGVGLETATLSLDDPSSEGQLLEDLELQDGVIFANSYVAGPFAIVAVSDSPESRARRMKRLASLQAVTQVGGGVPFWLPKPTKPLRESDLPLIAPLREAPSEPSVVLAAKLGITAKTFTRRVVRLRETGRLLVSRAEDFSKFPTPVGIIEVVLTSEKNSRALAAEVRRNYPQLIENAASKAPPFSPHSALIFMGEFDNLSRINDLVAELRKYPDVRTVSTRFPGRERFYSGWIDNSIHNALAAKSLALAQ